MSRSPFPIKIEKGFFMKYSLEFKLECVKKYKKGIEIKKPDFANTSQKNFLNQVYFQKKFMTN